MTKSMLSFVWVAGPLSGLIMQPVVGAWSDNCTSSYGRRRPFMVIGSIIVGLSLMLMAWTREVVEIFVKSEEWVSLVTIIMAVLSVFTADFAVNAVQACCRAIIVDTMPKSKQELANAWAGRMVAGGHLVGYFMGFVDLVKYFPFLGHNQLKVLCAISSAALLLCVGITSFAVEEKVMILSDNHPNRKTSIIQILQNLFQTGFHLPRRIRSIFTVQLFAWYGWFTFLFYSSTWVGEIYVQYDAGDLSDSTDLVGDVGRVGSLALTVYSTITLLCSLVLPFIVVPPNSERHYRKSTYEGLPEPIIELLHFIAPYRPTLATAWMISHLVYALAMFGTYFVTSVRAATWIVGICGFSWALSSWAPYSLLAEEIRKLDLDAATASRGTSLPSSAGTPYEGYESLQGNDVTDTEDFDEEREIDSRKPSRQMPVPLTAAQNFVGAIPDSDDTISFVPASSSENPNEVTEEPSRLGHYDNETETDGDYENGSDNEEDENSEKAGIYLGLHNVSITIPQFISTFMSFIVFSILDPGKSEELTGGEEQNNGAYSIGVTLRLGGITALGAAYMTYRLRKGL
ncbi:hypothetical protein V1511DRAFT_522108 [Dipodascopsis uninucleata]